MIKRTSKKYIDNLLQNNTTWNILDIGCGYNANKFAKVICDVQDLSNHYQDKKFIRLSENKLPFKDKEFDYVILSHVMEHVPNLLEFKDEIVRIAKAGYIELPTKLNDNIVFGCDEEVYGHKWWFEFDDDNQKLLYTPKKDAIEKFLSVGSVWKFQEFYEDSFLLQFYWNDNIELKEREPFIIDKKISFLSLVKKYCSKKLRIPISKLKNIIKKN